MAYCDKCGYSRTQVIESRPTIYLGGDAVRRRRWCRKCGERHTTYELLAATLEGLVKRAEYSGGEPDPDYPDMAAVKIPVYWADL